MVLKSYSKVNLSLRVNNKLKSGLHEIQSYYCLVNLSDKIHISKTNKKKDKIVFKGQFVKHIKKTNNSIINILKFLRKLKLISSYYSLIVTKNVPVFSGLGGGTSNAAFILKFFLKDKINKSILNKTEKLIGSDLRLFLYKQGYLENLKTIKALKKRQKLFFLLSSPKINCSTREIFSKVTRSSKKTKFNFKKINTREKFIKYISAEKNELQSIVEKKYPIIKKLLINISAEKGCYFSRMTGSGSVCYGLFNSERNTKKALRKIKIKHPKFWFSIAKTV
jgi:4-diphosphocytidyl-2-C-methyl-D-erythritol kinase